MKIFKIEVFPSLKFGKEMREVNSITHADSQHKNLVVLKLSKQITASELEDTVKRFAPKVDASYEEILSNAKKALGMK